MSGTYVKMINDLITEVAELKRAVKEQKETIQKFQALTGVSYPGLTFMPDLMLRLERLFTLLILVVGNERRGEIEKVIIRIQFM